MRRPISIRATIITALLLALTFPAAAAAGRYAELGSNTSASLFAAQPDGKLLLYGGSIHPFVARMLPSGELDPSFGGGDGIAPIPVKGSRVGISDAALLADGKVVAVARSLLGEDDASSFVVRLKPNGKPDRSFGSSGRAALPNTFGWTAPSNLAIDSQGRTIVVGSRYPGFTVAALLPSGQPDESFGEGGLVTGEFNPESSSETAEGLAILNDDRILISGTSLGEGPSYGYYIGLAQLLPNGSPDPAFGGGDGRAIGPGIRGQTGGNPYEDDSGGAPIVTDDGITIVGHAGSLGVHQCPSGLITRFDSEAKWDPGFGVAGVQLFPCTYGLEGAAGSGGSLLVAGYANFYPDLTYPRIGRFDAAGNPDLDFNRGNGLRGLRPAGLQGFATGLVESGRSFYFSASMTLRRCTAFARPTKDCEVATVTKLRADGSPVRSFGTAGIASFPEIRICRRTPFERCPR